MSKSQDLYIFMNIGDEQFQLVYEGQISDTDEINASIENYCEDHIIENDGKPDDMEFMVFLDGKRIELSSITERVNVAEPEYKVVLDPKKISKYLNRKKAKK